MSIVTGAKINRIGKRTVKNPVIIPFPSKNIRIPKAIKKLFLRITPVDCSPTFKYKKGIKIAKIVPTTTQIVTSRIPLYSGIIKMREAKIRIQTVGIYFIFR